MKDDLRRPDALAGVVLAGVSVLVLVESWRMPRDLQNWPAYAGPGVVTGLLGAVLLAMALGLLMRALRRPGAPLRLGAAEVRRHLARPQTRRLALMLLLCGAYLSMLGRGLPYALTTGGFLALTMLLFRARPAWLAVLVAAAAATGIAQLFNRVFLVPLP
jgi:hypothetical protein